MAKEKLLQDHFFLSISLQHEEGGDRPTNAIQLKALIVQALQTLHGQVGAAIPVDVLSCTTVADGCLATLRVPHSDVVKVWSALTLSTACGVVRVEKVRVEKVRVEKASASLISLAANSRSYQFPQ